jgi:hypothetical protein
MIKATRSQAAGSEVRILPCIHPDMQHYLTFVSASISGRTREGRWWRFAPKFVAGPNPATR